MNVGKIVAVLVIYVATAIAWGVLGQVTTDRSQSAYSRLGEGSEGGDSSGRASVGELWGTAQVQPAPTAWTTHIEKVSQVNDKGKRVVREVQQEDPVVLAKSRISTRIELEPRQKGLMWYSTYRVKFAGDYAIRNDFSNKRKFYFRFRFPQGQAAFDNVLLYANDKRVYPGGDLSGGVVTSVEIEPGETAGLKVSYGSQGLDTWNYRFVDDESVASVRDFEAAVLTNCKTIDFPTNCLSPTHKTLTPDGWQLRWQYGDLVSGSNIGVSMPQKLQPGPFASRLSKFAPVSLFFFFAVLLILGTVRGVRLHPVHYLFLAATFFSFHLLFSYMVDHVTPLVGFLVASAVSLLLTITYLRLVVNWKFAVLQAGVWQFIFLVLFTYAFFFEGYTGLTITIGAILTLAIMMQLTGRVNWDEAFSKTLGSVSPTISSQYCGLHPP